MSGVAIEELLGLWSAELRHAKDRLRPLFGSVQDMCIMPSSA
jgi:hypothetical protein